MRCRPVVSAAFALAVLAGCGRSGQGVAKGDGAPAGVPVRVATVVQKDAPIQLRAIGTVEAHSSVAVKSQVDGQLSRVAFTEGQEVRAGDLLFVVDPRPYEAALRQAEAARARDAAETERALADAGRFAALVKEGVVSSSEYERARTQAAALEATVKADEAAIEDAKLKLQFCYIHSPIDGRVGQLLVHEGNVVKENDTTLAVVNQVRPIYVDFTVPQNELPEIRRRAAEGTLAVTAVPSQGDGRSVSGELSFIDNAIDATTGTVLLKGLFPNQDEVLWPGQFVDVLLTLTVRHDAIVAPSRAIQTGQQGPYAFVVQPDDTVASRPVVPGEALDGEVVVREGLAAGDRVVTEGQIRLAPGTKVQVL
jgi:membrane fusion protein, multidrug efflux system